MNLLQHYRQLVNYDEWANLEVIGSFRAAGGPPARSLKLLAHVVAAEHVWLARLLQRPSPLPVWPELSLEQCEEQARLLSVSWRDYLAGDTAGSLDRTVSYKNSKGESWTSSVRDILTHVFMHSAYHRGQIATDMRQAGHVPPYTDFIHGVRQGLVV
ncbi:MAG: DinB family protein [Terriglobales bacterium]